MKERVDRGWGGGSGSPIPRTHVKYLGIVAYTRDPSSGKVETTDGWGLLATQPSWSSEFQVQVKDSISTSEADRILKNHTWDWPLASTHMWRCSPTQMHSYTCMWTQIYIQGKERERIKGSGPHSISFKGHPQWHKGLDLPPMVPSLFSSAIGKNLIQEPLEDIQGPTV